MFQGFPPAVVDFMWGIRFNNERGWFLEHKEEYLSDFYRPMQELGRQVYAAFHEKHPDLDVNLKVTRIYRDARRLHGRGPYKDHLWFVLERPREEWTADPAFWFELRPEGYSYGLGYYAAKSATMAKFRARLDRDPAAFEEVIRPLSGSELSPGGEEYKRPKGEAVRASLLPWYNRRHLSVSFEGPIDDLVFSPALADTLLDAYERLLPLYRYLATLDGDPEPGEE